MISFERDPDNREAFPKNVAGRSNVTLESKAVSGRPGSLWFSSEGNMGSRVITDPSMNRDKFIRVEAVTLDQVMAFYGLRKVDIVKMDIEGAEYGIIDEIGDFLTRYPARWMLEIHADDAFGGRPDIERIRRCFELHGYPPHQLSKGPGENCFFPILYAEPR